MSATSPSDTIEASTSTASKTAPAAPAAEAATPPRQKKGRSSYIFWNTLSSYLRDFVDAATLIFLTPLMIRSLGRDTYGLWSLIWAYVNLFSLLDMGLGASVVKYVADARGKKDTERLQRVICTLFWIYAGLGGLLMSGVFLSGLWFNSFFEIPPQLHSTAAVALVLVGLRAGLAMPFGMFRGVLIGHQRQSLSNFYKIGGSALYFCGIAALLLTCPDLKLLALVSLAAGVLPNVGMYLHARSKVLEVSLHPRGFSKDLVRDLTSFSIYFMIIQVAGLIYTNVGAIVTKSHLPLAMVGVYSIAMRLAEKANTFCSHLTKAMTPVVAELHGAGDRENMKAVWFRGTKVTLALAVPLLLSLAVLAAPLVQAWAGQGFELAAPTLQILLLGTFASILHGHSSNLLSMGGHQRHQALCLALGQVANLCLSLVLVRFLGVIGVALATCLVEVPLQVLFIQRRACKVNECPQGTFYARTLLPCLVPAALSALLLVGGRTLFPLTRIWHVAALAIPSWFVFWTSFWLFGLNTKERAYFGPRLRARIPFLKSR